MFSEGKPEGKCPLGRSRHRLDNIKVDRMGWYGQDWSGSGHRQVESSCEIGNELMDSIKCWEVLQ
jgi:hypothetical protein